MTQVVENWVKFEVGVCLTIDSPWLADHLYDGYVFYKLLERYNIINTQCVNQPKRASSQSSALWHLRQLHPWLKLIGISVPSADLTKISQKDRGKCLWLLFELYFRLKCRNNVNLITRAMSRAEKNLREKCNFKKKSDFVVSDCVSKNLREEYNSLREKIVVQCKEETRRRRELFKNEKSKTDTVGSQVSYCEFNETEENSSELISAEKVDSDVGYVKRGRLEDAILKLKMSNALMHDIWNSILRKREETFNNLLKIKLDQQRKFESQEAIRLIKLNDRVKKYFTCKVEPSHKSLHEEEVEEEDVLMEEDSRIRSSEKESILDLHNRLFREKLMRRVKFNTGMCQEIVSDLVDLAITMSEFYCENGVRPTRFVLNDWKELFFKGVPFFIIGKRDPSDQKETGLESASYGIDDMSYDDIRTLDTQLLRDRVICETLNRFYVHSYLYLVGHWKIEYWPELGNGKERLNIQGFIIHRLLECKYPFPRLPKPSSMDHLRVRSVIKNFVDPVCLNNLQILLKKPKVFLIKFNDAVRYCTDVYENEKSIVLNAVTKTTATESQTKRKKIRGPAVKEPEVAGDRWAVSRSQSVMGIVCAHKAVQCPEIAERHRFVKHSTVGKLGEEAWDKLETRTQFGNILSTKIVVEYIKNLKDYKGFVLTDFPNNDSQAVLFEFLMTGRPIESSWNVDEDVHEFIYKIMNPPYAIDTRRLVDLGSVFSNVLRETTLEVIPTKYDIRTAEKAKMDEEAEILEEENVVETIGETDEHILSNEANAVLSPKRQQIKNNKTRKKSISSKLSKDSRVLKLSNLDAGEELSMDSEMGDYVGLLQVEPDNVNAFMSQVSSVEINQLRTSKILPRPNPKVVYKMNKNTIITSCVAKLTEEKSNKPTSSLVVSRGQTLDPQGVGEGVCTRLTPPLDYYKSFNVLSSFIQPGTSFNPIDVARLILNETIDINDPQRVASNQLFGEEAVETSKRLTVQQMKKPSPTKQSVSPQTHGDQQNTESVKTKKARGKKDKKPQFASEKGSSETSDERTTYEEFKPVTIEHTPILETRKPGDIGWKYVDEPLPEDIQISLATHWEIIEYVYLEGLYQIMNLFRVHNANFFPYRNFIRNLMNEDVDYTDSRQQLVCNFQNLFNDVDDVYRQDPQMKMELHCKVHELWNRLCEMADRNKRVLEYQLQQLMDEGKILNYCFTLINIFLSLMQLEVDRYIDTVEIINEYYLHMLNEDSKQIKLEKVQLERIVIPSEEEEFIMAYNIDCSLGNIDLRNKVWDGTMQKLRKINDSIFLNRLGPKILTDLVKPVVQKVAKKSHNCLNAVKNLVDDTFIGAALKEKLKSKNKFQRRPGHRRCEIAPDLLKAFNYYGSKVSRSSKGGGSKSSNTTVESFRFSGTGLWNDIIEIIKFEWYTAIEDERNRLHFRVKLIESKLKYDLNEIFFLTQKLYENFKSDIVSRYHQEQKAIQRLRKVLISAVYKGCGVRQKMVLEKDRFYLDTSSNLFPELTVPPPTPWESVSEEHRFSMEQLNNFVDKMKYVAPDGIIGASFIHILEDMVTFTTDQYHPYLPVIWKVLDYEAIEYILVQAFGPVDVFDWRDFVIFNMNIPLPVIEHLLELKCLYQKAGKRFEENISYEQYKKIPLWLESTVGFVDDVQLAKNILFKLYRVNSKEMNYGAFLLAFCKDEDNLEGFMKALTLVDDKGLLLNAVEYMKIAKRRNEVTEIAGQIINTILHGVVLKTEGIIIRTLPKDAKMETQEEAEEEHASEEEFSDKSSCAWNSSSDDSSYIIDFQQQSEPEPTYPERYCHPRWHICVPHQLVLRLLGIACNSKLGSDNVVCQLESKLSDLYESKGKEGYVQAYVLAESDFLKQLFQSTGIFKWCNMTYFVEWFIRNRPAFNGHSMSVGL